MDAQPTVADLVYGTGGHALGGGLALTRITDLPLGTGRIAVGVHRDALAAVADFASAAGGIAAGLLLGLAAGSRSQEEDRTEGGTQDGKPARHRCSFGSRKPKDCIRCAGLPIPAAIESAASPLPMRQ
ncbi:hypothetical protein AKJ08_3283 [Vulgatibacter incomptus]|uniref:Uncharacterized protein n=1 Tax=Vulgatibacter incomptus TaxID=1391653 RepID=A0A0K1PHM0_9BACT|nr:hypothetical protein AKJ08_3283 [Vulgatibacter incomptus]